MELHTFCSTEEGTQSYCKGKHDVLDGELQSI